MALTFLRRARLERGLTQLDLALKTGIAASRLSVVERGILQPTAQEVDRIAATLKITADALLGRSNAAEDL
ncbi:MAG TPA: helix-turn-helix transcriptional regulator [Vicinamibacterales bacterium]|nr:helix-turn-helix transcriptional regulator [Vicinamibacterales bacterium]